MYLTLEFNSWQGCCGTMPINSAIPCVLPRNHLQYGLLAILLFVIFPLLGMPEYALHNGKVARFGIFVNPLRSKCKVAYAAECLQNAEAFGPDRRTGRHLVSLEQPLANNPNTFPSAGKLCRYWLARLPARQCLFRACAPCHQKKDRRGKKECTSLPDTTGQQHALAAQCWSCCHCNLSS